MDVILAQLALFFVPGIVWASVEAGFTPGSRHSGGMFLARAFLFGSVANAILYGGYLLSGFSFFDLRVIDQTGILDLSSVFDELALSVLLALILSILWLFAGTHRILVRLLHRIGATQRFGDSSVWEFLMNADQAPVEYVHVRDTANDVIICGWVDSFSEDSDLREMLLRDAIVYDLDGQVVSQSPYLYISRERADLWVELPYAERETRRFSKQKVGAIKQIFAGETVKGGHNGLSLITERPDPPFPPKAAEEQKSDPPPDRPGRPPAPSKDPRPSGGGAAPSDAADKAEPAKPRPMKVEPPVARAPARRKFR
ncbi:MAG: DUF6338 family protein [Pseudomonadota bacterium]